MNMTHRNLLITAAAAGLALAAPAAAQDNIWTGFYIGGNLGGAWGDTSIKTVVSPGSGTIVIPPGDVGLINQVSSDDDNKAGFTGGVQIGYNWQSDSLLFGIEADFGAFDIDQQRTNTYTSTVTVSPPIFPTPAPVVYALDQRVKTGEVWTVRPRLGYASGPWLFYATGGVAGTKVKLRTQYADTRTPPNTAEISDSKSKTGWAAGLGGAYMFGTNWSVRGEWLYADFGNVSDAVATPNGFVSVGSEASVKANILRLGVDYKF
jgi:outer membrane immunogenic protein